MKKHKLILTGKILDENGQEVAAQELTLESYQGFPLHVKEIGVHFMSGLDAAASRAWTQKQEDEAKQAKAAKVEVKTETK